MRDVSANIHSAEALAAANICPGTRLATDYLNHFNEVAMLLDMVADMPDVAEDILEWAPLDYVGHFESSGFRDKALAIAAYEAVDPEIKQAFLERCEAANTAVGEAQADLKAGDFDGARARRHELFVRISDINGVIVGDSDGLDEADASDTQDAIDALFA